MKLTEDESKILHRLKWRERSWCAWGKWWFVASVVAFFVLCWRILGVLSYARSNSERSLIDISALMLFAITVALGVFTLQNWNGTSRTLLIKLIDAARKEEWKNSAAQPPQEP